MNVYAIIAESFAALHKVLYSAATSPALQKTALSCVAIGPLATQILSKGNLCSRKQVDRAHRPIVLLISSGAGYLIMPTSYLGVISIAYNVISATTSFLSSYRSKPALNTTSTSSAPKSKTKPSSNQNPFSGKDSSNKTEPPSPPPPSTPPPSTPQPSTPPPEDTSHSDTKSDIQVPPKQQSPQPDPTNSSPPEKDAEKPPANNDPLKSKTTEDFVKSYIETVGNETGSRIAVFTKTAVLALGEGVMRAMSYVPERIQTLGVSDSDLSTLREETENQMQLITDASLAAIAMARASDHVYEDLRSRGMWLMRQGKRAGQFLVTQSLQVVLGIGPQTQKEVVAGLSGVVKTSYRFLRSTSATTAVTLSSLFKKTFKQEPQAEQAEEQSTT